jgi:acetolactate synthase-1/2/3 large subunit
VVVISSGAGIGARPEADATSKASLAVTTGSAAHWIAHACQLSMKEPWGPVHLDLPPALAGTAALPVATSCRPAPLAVPDAEVLDAAARRLEASERPLVVVGRFCRSEADAAWIRAFTEARPAPVLATPRGRGVVPDPHPLLIGTLDAGEAERTLLASADLIVAIGVDSKEVATGWPGVPAPVLEITPVAAAGTPVAAAGTPVTAAGTPVAAGAPSAARQVVVGDIGLVLEELAPRLRDRRLAEWDVARLHAWKQAAAAPPADPRARASWRTVETARRLTPATTTAVFDGGEVWSEAARAWQAVAPGECPIATGGFPLAATAAAQIARPGRRVVCFTDAETIRRAPDQLAMLGALDLPVLVVVGGDASAAALVPPAGLRSFASGGFAAALEDALAAGGPALLSAGAH